jgi:hypothetical protein
VEAHPLEIGEDATTFFQPRAEVFVTMLWVIAAGWLACRGLYVLVLLALGMPPTAADIVTIAESLLIVPVIAASVVILVAWRRLGWLKSSVLGIEFAATGRRGVHLPWPAVASVGLRRWGPFTVRELAGPGRRPRILRRAAGPVFLIDVGMMSPGPQTLLAELHRRIPSRV